MFRRLGIAVVLSLGCAFIAPSAQAAETDPLTLTSHQTSVAGPYAPATECDFGSELNCGLVAVTADFSGLAGRTPPADPTYPDGDLTGSVRVTRTYGCQSAQGRRLHRYDITVTETAPLETRRSFGYTIPVGDDAFEVTTYAFLQDAQPGNCPPGTTPMTYRIKARNAKLVLTSYWDSIPSANYRAPGKAHWKGAVPTPTPPVS